MEYSKIISSIWSRKIDFYDVLKFAAHYESANELPEAAVLYKTWIDRNIGSYNAVAYFNLGVIYFSLGDYERSAESYEAVKNINPNLLQARLNIGLVKEKLGLSQAACEEWMEVEKYADIQNKEHLEYLTSAFNNIGRLQEKNKIYDQANIYFNKSLALNPAQEDVLHHLVFVRARQCLWPVYEAPAGVDLCLMKESTSALAMVALSDDPEMQLSAAVRYASKKAPTEKNPLSKKENYGHKKIKIGYCSSDFCLHPVSMLMVEVLELHDRDRFEVFGFCWSRDDGSALRTRVVDAFDHYIPIHGLSDEAAAKKIRELEIDILIDLQGQTAGARMNILAWRPAPIQITYLGLPATTGIDSIDYMIADKFLIPDGAEKFYSEKIIYMPDVYQASDRKRVHTLAPSRKECGLPDEGFIFCSFNNNYKYTEDVFQVWLRILNRVPGSVLWLLSDNEWAEKNLRTRLVASGIDSERLVFAERALPEDYLARYQLADLFLDTYPFNGGTTANDVLWMGLPLLTMSGRTFASRMAGALLTAAKLPELITFNLLEYENKAVELALNKSKLRKIKTKIANLGKKTKLFDMDKFIISYEERLEEILNGLSLSSTCALNIFEVISIAEKYQNEGDFSGAKKIYEDWMLDKDGEEYFWVASFNLAVLWDREGDFSKAKEVFDNILKEKGDVNGVKNILESTNYKNLIVKADTCAAKSHVKFTVIIPTHQRSNLLKRALLSIKSQKIPQGCSVEVIVIADVHNVETDKICSDFLEADDIYMVRTGACGPAESRNWGLDKASGDMVMFLDDDDAWCENFIWNLLASAAFDIHQPVYMNCIVVNEIRTEEATQSISEVSLDLSGKLTEEIFVKNQIQPSCYIIPSKLAKSIRFDPQMKAYEDWDYFLQVFSISKPRHLPVLGSRIHEVHQGASDRRGAGDNAKGWNAVLDYLYVYKKNPAPMMEIKNKRSDFLRCVGIDIPADCL